MKTLSYLVRQYVGQHPGTMAPLVQADDSPTARREVGATVARLIREREIVEVNGRLYLTSTKTVASAVCR